MRKKNSHIKNKKRNDGNANAVYEKCSFYL